MTFPLPLRARLSLWVRLAIRAALTALVLFPLFRWGPALCSLLGPFLLALPVAWALHPAVCLLTKKLGLSRRLLAFFLLMLCVALLLGAVFAVGYAALTQAKALVSDWASIRTSLLDLFSSLSAFFSSLADTLPPALAEGTRSLIGSLTRWAGSLLPAALDASLSGAGDLVSRVPSFAVSVLVFVLAGYFFTSDYPRLRFLATHRLPSPLRDFARSVRRIVKEAFGGWLKSQFILSLSVFFLLAVGFFLIRQPYSLLLAALLAVLDFIPLLGAGIVLLPWSAVRLLWGDLPGAAALLLLWGLVTLFRRLAEPKVLGDRTGLSPILSLLGIYVGMRVAGIAGMVLGPIFLMIFLSLVRIGTFDPLCRDLSLCFRDLHALLSTQDDQTP